MATIDHSLDRGLPASVDAERAILGAVLLDNSSYPQAAEFLLADDFSLDSHRRIYLRMMELAETGKPVDFVTLTEQLGQHKEIEAVGGVAYVTSLTDGLPRVKNIEQYVRIVKDKALLRGLIHAASSAIQKAYEQDAPAEEIVDAAEAAIFQVAEKRIGQGFLGIPEIVKSSFGSIDKLYEQGQRITGRQRTDGDQRLIEDPEPLGPWGAKGVGEPGLIPTAPAILGAIHHATGVRMRQVPVLPHRMRAALKQAQTE